MLVVALIFVFGGWNDGYYERMRTKKSSKDDVYTLYFMCSYCSRCDERTKTVDRILCDGGVSAVKNFVSWAIVSFGAGATFRKPTVLNFHDYLSRHAREKLPLQNSQLLVP